MSVVADPRTLERFGQSETYHALFAVHRGINALHSAAWTDATRLIQKGGIALIHHERLDEFGLPDWASLWASKVTGDNPRFETAMVLARRMLEGRPRDPRPQLSPLLLERALFRAHVALVEDWTL
ncbi:hypothetical protein B1L11_14205 [Microbispora sp. GKU 823]|nr:hypothetical protein B1L11_14205 [Microbispora sp. GKU 823]